ncbi:unnamed protein product (mitochondrion) [Plasmodiophora brassicae]|uniref:DDT domain-containing protein n=1 Tax=Plasmodiophora brassicae TaxID=37360 RepID=A0A3P3XZ74_PLABS|nr:unnamed protein product [Plasmodiophora brassicae]
MEHVDHDDTGPESSSAMSSGSEYEDDVVDDGEDEDEDEDDVQNDVTVEVVDVPEPAVAPGPADDVPIVDVGGTAEFANILSFCRAFATVLNMPPFSFLELEQSILFSRDDPLYVDLVARCIFLGQNRKEALKPDQWQSCVHKIVKDMRSQFVGFADPNHDDDETYQSLVDDPRAGRKRGPILDQWQADVHSMSPYAKLLILSNLCDWCAQSSFEIQDFVARASCELRDSPLGEDARGNFMHPSQTLAHADADGADPLLGKLCNVLKTELIPAELARIEAEERKAQRLKRQGLALGLDLSYSNIVDGRRSTTRPVRYTFEDSDGEDAGRRRPSHGTATVAERYEGTRSRPGSSRRQLQE